MSAPSFSSFPPSFSSFPDLEEKDSRAGSGAQGHKERSDRDHGSDRPKKRKYRDSGHRKESKRRNVHTPLTDERQKEEEDRHARLGSRYDAGERGLFVVDKTGDPMNVVYGGLHSSDIPRYKRVGYGNVMGLGQAFKIITRGTGGKTLEIAISGRRPFGRYTDSRSLSLLTAQPTHQLIVGNSGSRGKTHDILNVDAPLDFIPLPSRRSNDTEDPLSTYRSILPNHENASDFDSDTSSRQDDKGESSSESDAAEETAPRSAHQHALEKLETDLQKDPTSLQTWLAVLEQTLTTIPLSTKSSLSRARAEIKLAVLDRAMRAHPQNNASVELRVKWLGAGAEVWDSERLEREWDAAVTQLGGRKNTKDARNRMWEEWFLWRASSLGKGTRKGVGVEGVVEDAIRASENTDGELAKVKILWCVAVLLRNAGFSERAMAVFQAQVELSLHCPPSLASAPLTVRLDALEEFWEAELPRVGEADARGWAAWDAGGKQTLTESGPSSSSRGTFHVDAISETDPYSRWAAEEAMSAAESAMPMRNVDGDDPYAMILISDVRPLLMDITTREGKHALRIALLCFMGMHVPGFSTSLSAYNSRDDVWSPLYLSRAAVLRQLFPSNGKGKENEWDAYAGTIIAREKSYASAFGCVKEWGWGVFSPLESVNNGESKMWNEADVEDVDKVMIRSTFDQLRRKVGSKEDQEWDIMAIAFEAAVNIKSAIKLSKTLLSNARDSFPLWGAHARLERMRGRYDEARRIYDTALTAAHANPGTTGIATLWWEWAEMEWLSGADDNAKNVILRSAALDPASHGAMMILRAKRTLEGFMRGQNGSMDWKERESWLCLRALLEVLTGPSNALEEAMLLMEDYVRDSALEGVAKESARTRMVLMAWKHARLLGRQVRRKLVRERTFEIVREDERFWAGANTVVLGVFLDWERGESVWGKVRALVGEGVSDVTQKRGLTLGARNKSVTRRIWEVWLATYERGHWEAEKERVRNSLDMGVRDERTRGSPILWRVYIEFEMYFGEWKRAKSLLFRAVSECPLVKELYLFAFGPLRSVFTPRELEGWAETMAERGIRMHRGLEEYIVAGVKDGESEEESMSEGEAELEKEARDYRRLAPF